MGLHGLLRRKPGVGGARIRAAAAVLALSAGVASAQAPSGLRPMVVELFTAQGCASCPQANEMVGELAERDDLVALTFAVDYWDYLGWRDTFAKPEFTARQRAYVARLQLKDIYTPEVVINGRREAPGVDEEALSELIDAEARRRSAVARPRIRFSGDGEWLTVGAGSAFRAGADVWLIRYDPARREVRVRSGDNDGRVVSHVNIVRELNRLGGWNGRPRTYQVPEPGATGLHTVVLVQGAGAGPILAALAAAD